MHSNNNFKINSLKRICLVLTSMWLFLVGLQIIRLSIHNAELSQLPLDTIQQFFDSIYHSFSIGWLGNTIIMSGSPIAALGISMFASGLHSNVDGLAAMIFGSRAGPDLIMFIIGTATLLKGRTISQSFSLGLIEFFTTLSVAGGSLLIYLLLFSNHPVGGSVLELFGSYKGYTGITEYIINPVAELIATSSGSVIGLFIGFGTLIISIFAFDKYFSFSNLTAAEKNPEAHSPMLRWWYRERFNWKMSHGGRILRWMHDYLKLPFMAFLLGALVTGITLSVAISVALILPFYAYGLINERSAIAYILAANITTFIDTFFIAILTRSPSAVAVIIDIILSVTLCATVYLVLFKPYGRMIKTLTAVIVARPWRIFAVLSMAILFPIPAFFIK